MLDTKMFMQLLLVLRRIWRIWVWGASMWMVYVLFIFKLFNIFQVLNLCYSINFNLTKFNKTFKTSWIFFDGSGRYLDTSVWTKKTCKGAVPWFGATTSNVFETTFSQQHDQELSRVSRKSEKSQGGFWTSHIPQYASLRADKIFGDYCWRNVTKWRWIVN